MPFYQHSWLLDHGVDVHAITIVYALARQRSLRCVFPLIDASQRPSPSVQAAALDTDGAGMHARCTRSASVGLSLSNGSLERKEHSAAPTPSWQELQKFVAMQPPATQLCSNADGAFGAEQACVIRKTDMFEAQSAYCPAAVR